MPKDTPSMAKNKIRRSLMALFDPYPSDKKIDELWQYFDSRCVYCDTKIERKSRTGHLDHLVPSSEKGTNDIYNHALSCARCNGDEKREELWQLFLAKKPENLLTHNERKEKIECWLSRGSASAINQEIAAEAECIIKQAITNFETSVQEMKKLRTKST